MSQGDPSVQLEKGPRKRDWQRARTHHPFLGNPLTPPDIQTNSGPILRNSALDRLANASYQIVIEGSSYRERLSPHLAIRDAQQGGD